MCGPDTFMTQTQRPEYISGMLFLCRTQASFLCPMLCETMESSSYLPWFLAVAAQFFASCYVLFIHCQMSQGENSCSAGLTYCTFYLPCILASSLGCFDSSILQCLSLYPFKTVKNFALVPRLSAPNLYSSFQLLGLMLLLNQHIP